MEHLKPWVLRLIVVMTTLSLAISIVLSVIVSDGIQLTKVTRCWDRVLDNAVHVARPSPTSRAILMVQANKCAKLKLP